MTWNAYSHPSLIGSGNRARTLARPAPRLPARVSVPPQPGRWTATQMTEPLQPRRFMPSQLQRPATKAPMKLAPAWLTTARRFAETEAVRASAAVLAVAAVAFLATLVWLWAFGK